MLLVGVPGRVSRAAASRFTHADQRHVADQETAHVEAGRMDRGASLEAGRGRRNSNRCRARACLT